MLDAGFPAGVVGGFTSRDGGVSAAPWDTLNLALHVDDDPAAVLVNRATLARRLGTDRVAFPEQVHGSNVALLADRAAVDPGHWAGGSGCDAVVTAVAGLAIGVLVADCMPVLVAEPAAGVVAAAHAGRRGLSTGVLAETIAAMVALGAAPARMTAVVGPAICGRCYEVPDGMRDEVDSAVPGTAARTRDGTPSLDLVAGAVRVLEAAGVSRVRSVGVCTAEDARYYSYRRDGVTGRFAGVIMLDRR